MQFFLRSATGLFDLLFQPFLKLNPLYSLAVFSFLSGALTALVFRLAADRSAIRRAKDRIQAHVLAVRLFQDQLKVALPCYGSILRGALAYLRLCSKPLAVIWAPVLLIMAQLDMRLGWTAPRPGENFLINVKLSADTSLEQVSLHLPAGLRASAPPVRMRGKREITWRLEAQNCGEFFVQVNGPGEGQTKQVVVASGIARLSSARVRNILVQALVYPGEPPLPPGGYLDAIEVKYSPRNFELNGYHVEWWVLFLAFSFLSALAVKPLAKAEF
jgi:hypothetical protein